MSEVKTSLPSESGHWYAQDGTPVYEVPRAKGEGTRPTTLADARKMSLVPSVTAITRCAAAPGLEAWKARQLLESSLTLPPRDGETLDDYAKRVVEDSKAQSEKAREAGTALHKAIELYIGGEMTSSEWDRHLAKLDMTLAQYGINIQGGKPEHCFASPLGYGGKLDWHNDEVLIDFKTSATVGNKKQVAWPEHVWQLSAYDHGLESKRRRLINVFVGIEDQEVRIHEWPRQDCERGWAIFECLLRFWQLHNNYNGVTP